MAAKDYRLLAIYSSLILAMPMTLLGGYFLGRAVDEYFQTEPIFMVIGLSFGAAGVFFELYQILKKSSSSGGR